MQITTVGLDLAKRIFQVHAVDASGDVVVRKALRRSQVLPFFTKLPPCLIGMEACGTSHHWARELTELGHEVRLMPPAYVKSYVKWHGVYRPYLASARSVPQRWRPRLPIQVSSARVESLPPGSG